MYAIIERTKDGFYLAGASKERPNKKPGQLLFKVESIIALANGLKAYNANYPGFQEYYKAPISWDLSTLTRKEKNQLKELYLSGNYSEAFQFVNSHKLTTKHYCCDSQIQEFSNHLIKLINHEIF